MNIKQKQALMTFLGYDTGGVDGQWGQKSEAALLCCQEDLGIPADGVWGQLTETAVLEAVYTYDDGPVAEDTNVPGTTGTFWDEIEYFTREEFRCQCGGRYCNGFHVEPKELLVRICDEIRRRAGVPIAIRDAGGSGLRCPQHNASIPGAAINSLHVEGRAADLHPYGMSPAALYRIAEQVTAEIIPGRGGIGLYDWGVHVDDGKYSRWNG